MLRLFIAIILTPLLLKAPYFIPPYETHTLWWLRPELFFAYSGMVLFGIPLIFLFIRKRWLKWWQVTLGATLAAGFLVTAYFLLTNWQHFLQSGLGITIYGLLSGVISGLVFWLVAFWRNPRFAGPNNSFKPNLSAGAAKSA
ncbi:hypothetical protein [Pseudoxanthomonas sp. PXM01]|uniref:hypothetical protein n=1 Tax=Pseudoxanthomonas sp. PXM01 TaxID=2769295 RepID=UPI00178729D0|nr:hypothetical protein [Pseudoxanthomonas sp. PXM01]MBD9471165.1 hypothetical protein [Pseudoxanthomonas sp. PXM01]